jgi:NADH dehydrogenase FAD-containing subunit
MTAAATSERTHVVVVGGGLAGLAVVRELSKVARHQPIAITLIDKRNHHTFQPLLYQVATAGLQAHDIGVTLRSIRSVQRRAAEGRPITDVRMGEVVAVDDQVVRLADGTEVAYDRLVVAAGGITNDLGIPGVAEHAFGLKSLPEATQLRNHLLRRFEEASADPTRLDDGTLTFVIAGGGPTGVELAGAVAELVDQVLSRAPDVHMLATSQETLDVNGETVWSVPPLDLPDAGSGPAPAAVGDEAGSSDDAQLLEGVRRSSAARLFEARAAAAASPRTDATPPSPSRAPLPAP